MVVYLSWTLDREGIEDSPRVSKVRYLTLGTLPSLSQLLYL